MDTTNIDLILARIIKVYDLPLKLIGDTLDQQREWVCNAAPRIHIGNSGQLPGGRDPPKWLRGSMRYIFTSLLSRLGLAGSATSRLCAAVLVIFGDFCELIQ